MMRKLKVPFETEETVWNRSFAIVEAESAEEAFAKVERSIEESNPYRDFNAVWDGINTVTSEVIETSKYGIGEDYGVTIDDVEDVTDEISIEIEFGAFDLLRMEKDAIYTVVEHKLDGIQEVFDMDIVPIGVSGNAVKYKCIIKEYDDIKCCQNCNKKVQEDDFDNDLEFCRECSIEYCTGNNESGPFVEKFECPNCGVYYWVEDRSYFECPKCETMDC